MRWWWLLVVAACSNDRVVVPASVVHVDVAMTACSSECQTPLPLYEICGPATTRIDATTHEVETVASRDPAHISGVVEVIYTGAVADDDNPAHAPYLAYVLEAGERVDVRAAGDGALLYSIDQQDGVVELDRTRLTAASGNELRFEYPGTVEQHVVDKPRPVALDVSSDWGCCSTSRASTGLLWLLALIQISARRRCRRARLPRR